MRADYNPAHGDPANPRPEPDLVESLRESGDPVQEQAAEYIVALRKVAQAGVDLCENIRERGVHDNWKTLANAIQALPTE